MAEGATLPPLQVPPIKVIPNNPTHSTNPTPGIYPNPFHHITAVEYVRFDGYIWSFYPRGRPLFTPNSANYLPANFEGVSYRRGPQFPALVSTDIRGAPE
jgi:hypothetical protein